MDIVALVDSVLQGQLRPYLDRALKAGNRGLGPKPAGNGANGNWVPRSEVGTRYIAAVSDVFTRYVDKYVNSEGHIEYRLSFSTDPNFRLNGRVAVYELRTNAYPVRFAEKSNEQFDALEIKRETGILLNILQEPSAP